MQNSPKSHREANDTSFFGQVDKSLYLIFSQEKKKWLANSLYSFAYNLCKHTEEAQDLFQGSLERIISNQEKFRPWTNLKAWCFTIMKNLFINEYRKKIKRNTILDSTDNTFLLDSNVVNNRSDWSLLFKELKFLVETLDENLKIPFIKHFEGHKYQEIADELELPLGTIKSRIFFARKELRSSIKEIYGVDSSCYTLLLD